MESREKQNMDPARFALTLRELLSLEKTDLKEKISYIRENQKLDPSALFATQYAEAIKLREGVDPNILQYEELGLRIPRSKFQRI